MTYFDLGVSEKDQAASDFMSRLNRKLIAALFEEQTSPRRMTKAKIAKLLNVDRSVVTKMFKGSANLTERSIGETLWALGYRGELHLEKVGNHNEQGPTPTKLHLTIAVPTAPIVGEMKKIQHVS